MLYSIIPPILVILSLVGIIIFLAKKAPQVALIEDQGSGTKNLRGIFGRKNDAAERVAGKIDFKHRTLVILEKIMSKFKGLFLKLGGAFTRWGELIRQKRKTRQEEINVLESAEAEKELEDKIVSFDSSTQTVEESRPEERIFQEEKPPRPLVSEAVAVAAPKKETKDHLERILIDRIASNPKDIEAYERLGEYYMEIENWGYAKECFKQIVKLDPRNKNVRIKMRKLERLLSQ